MKEFADNNFKFDEYGGKFSKKVENTVGKGEIAHYEQFLLFQQCFQKTFIVMKDHYFPIQQILNASKLKELADDNFKFDENGRNIFKPVENTMAKG